MFVRLSLVTLASFLFCRSATAQDVTQALKQQCEGEILVLRHSLQNNSQQYDSDGRVLKGGREGPWTLYGRMKVDEVELTVDNSLLLKGHRVDYKYVASQHRLTPFPNKEKIQVRVSLHGPPRDVAEIDEILGRVFALTKKDVLESVPDFWRPYLDKNIEPKPPEKKDDASTLAPGLAIAKIGHGVQPPQPVFTPEPAFPEKARDENFQGIVVLNVVVDQTGTVQNIRLVRPQGMGMEEAAVATVKTWRFKPARRNSQPVAVEMNIEVAFNVF